MRRLIQKLFDIRDGEWLRAILMFAYIFLVIASLMIVKPIRNSLFLTRFGVNQLPFVYVLVAIAAAFVVWLYSKFSSRVRLNQNIFYTNVIAIVIFAFSWLLLNRGYLGAWFIYSFYIWVAIFGVITSAQFWLLANYVFNAREAKRLFGFIGAGGIIGGIFGGYLTNYLAKDLSTHNLIFICIAFLIVCIFLLWSIWTGSTRNRYQEKFERKKTAQTAQDESLLNIFKRSRHLLYVAAIVGVGVIIANLVDYQFNAAASSFITDEDELTAFFGFWLSTLGVISLIIQLLFTGRVLKYAGVVASLMFLPLGIFLGAAAIMVFPALWSAVLIKVSDGSFKHSINKAGMELLMLPIPAAIKNRAKTFIDVFVDNLATGIGGILLIIITLVLDLSIQYISLVIIVLVLILIYLIVRVRHEYIESFRHAIEKRTINFAEQTINVRDASVLKSFIKVLDGDNERQILYVLNLFGDINKKELIPYLEKLIDHPSTEIKSLVMELALDYPELNLTDKAELLLRQGNQDVRISAISYICQRSEDELSSLIAYIEDNDLYVRGAAMLYAARMMRQDSSLKEQPGIRKHFDRLAGSMGVLNESDPEIVYIKTISARVAGIAGDSKLYPYLHLMLNDSNLDVVRQAIVSAGRSKQSEFIPVLIPFLGKKYLRIKAREALAEFGEEVIAPLAKYLEHESSDWKIKLSIPRVLSLIGSSKSVKVLLKHIDQSDLILRYEIIKALSRLRQKYSNLKIDNQKVKDHIYDESRNYFKVLAMLNYQLSFRKLNGSFDRKDIDLKKVEKAQVLLIKALEERLDNNLERIFRLLGLRYVPQDMYNAYLGVLSRKSDLQANSIEFLDNILEPRLKRLIIPIVEAGSSKRLLSQTQSIINVDLPVKEQCFDFILTGNDNWLKVCTLYFLTEVKSDRCMDIIARLTNDYDPMVKETADRYIKTMTSSN